MYLILKVADPKKHLMDFGTRNLKYWVLGASGFVHFSICECHL